MSLKKKKSDFCLNLAAASFLVQPTPLQATVRASNKSDQRYGNAFERKWLRFQLLRSCVHQMLKRKTMFLKVFITDC